MKKIISPFLILFIFPSFFLSTPGVDKHVTSLTIGGARPAPTPQSIKKPNYDYMSSILSRNTKPLGLKDNLPLRRFLNQSSFKWAIRSGGRHILN